jgi:hypothetical protein
VQPQGSQWFRLRGGGTYSFGHDPGNLPTETTGTLHGAGRPVADPEDDNPTAGNVYLEVFNQRDLSRPISPYHMDGEPDKYHLADGESYLIRVWHHDPGFVGRFELAAHRHTGRFHDMRTLLPNEPSSHVANAGEITWFQVDTDTPFAADRLQTLTFRVDRPGDFSLTVHRTVGNGQERVINMTSNSDGSFSWTDPQANGTQLHLALDGR